MKRKIFRFICHEHLWVGVGAEPMECPQCRLAASEQMDRAMELVIDWFRWYEAYATITKDPYMSGEGSSWVNMVYNAVAYLEIVEAELFQEGKSW